MKNLLKLRRKLLPLGLTLSLLLAGGFLWLNQPTQVSANISDYTLAENTFAAIPGSRIDNCSLCHSSVPSLNPYGSAYKSGGRGMASSLTNINNLDSDGDGFSNLQEINSLTYPGDALDFPLVSTVTATATTAPTATSTTAPSVTPVSPTATQPNPTATQVNPTATRPAATATQVGPTATKPAVTATVTKEPKLTKTAVTETKEPKPTKITGTPTVRPTPVKQCVKNDDDYRQRAKERASREGKSRPNPCPPDYHDREDSIRPREKKDDSNILGQIVNTFTGWFSTKRNP